MSITTMSTTTLFWAFEAASVLFVGLFVVRHFLLERDIRLGSTALQAVRVRARPG